MINTITTSIRRRRSARKHHHRTGLSSVMIVVTFLVFLLLLLYMYSLSRIMMVPLHKQENIVSIPLSSLPSKQSSTIKTKHDDDKHNNNHHHHQQHNNHHQQSPTRANGTALSSEETTISKTKTTSTASDASSTTDDASLTTNVSSTVQSVSRGMDRYTHVCLHRVKNRHMELRTYYSPGDDDDDYHHHNNDNNIEDDHHWGIKNGGTMTPSWIPSLNATQLSSIPDAKANYFEWILRSHGYPNRQWVHDTRRATLYVPRSAGPTVFAFDIFQNPGHCLSDMIWSVALDRYERRQSVSSSSSSSSSSGIPFSHFVWGDRDALDPARNYDHDWCYQFIHATKWFGTRWERASTTAAAKGASPAVCFDELWIPSFSLFRFPLRTMDQVKSLRRYSFMWKNMRTHDFTSHWSWSYPRGALQDTRSAVAQSLGFTMEPWPDQTTTSNNNTILFLDRLGNARRQWKNAAEVRRVLEERYPYVHVQLIHDDAWDQYTFHQQATLFHSASHIVTVHAGAEANLIFCRPGTRVIELACLGKWDPQAQSNMTQPPPRVANDGKEGIAWYGPVGWYSSFTRPLGIHHYVLSDTLNCTLGKGRIHDAAELVVDVNMTVQFMASRMGL